MSDDPRARAQARVGSVLAGKWTLERLIGLGGMAAVYAGRHRNGARAAIKVLDPALGRVPEVRERFLREGYAANKVEHPGAVKVLDDDVVRDGPEEGLAYLVMELLEGESLEERIFRRGLPLPTDEALAIVESVLDVLVAAHAHGVIHRDLKPENLFLVESESSPFGFERVKILDFGLARLAHLESVTRAGVAIGTPSYMAPEQAEGRTDEIDGRTDVFAVGAILFRLLAGRRVHEAAHPIELVTKMAKLPAPPLRSVRDDVPEPIAAVVDRALRFRREERYPSAAAMRADVSAVRQGRSPELAESMVIGSEPTLLAPTLVPQTVTSPPAETVVGSASPAAFSPLPAAVSPLPEPPAAAPGFAPVPHAAPARPRGSRKRRAPALLAVALLAVFVLATAALVQARRTLPTAQPSESAAREPEPELQPEPEPQPQPDLDAAPAPPTATSPPPPPKPVTKPIAPKPKPKPQPKKPSSKKKK